MVKLIISTALSVTHTVLVSLGRGANMLDMTTEVAEAHVKDFYDEEMHDLAANRAKRLASVKEAA